MGGGSSGNLVYPTPFVKRSRNEQGPMKINLIPLLIRVLLMVKMRVMFYLLTLLDIFKLLETYEYEK